jgi:environmental stress-induced protein Ves
MINNTPIGTRVEQAAQAPGTWAGGTTSAIYAYPPESIGAPAAAQLWVGTATIERAAAYSHFPERLRIHLPIQGSGIRLHFQNPAEVVALSTFTQHSFDGARPVQVELVAGPVVAFNLIVQANVAAEVQVLRIGSQEMTLDLDRAPATAPTDRPASIAHVLYAAAGAIALAIAGQPAITLQPGDAFVFHPRAVADRSGATVGLSSLAATSDVVIATLVFATHNCSALT